MRIAIYADRLDLMGGVETHVITQVNELLKRGHQIFLSTNAIIQHYLDQVVDKENFTYAKWTIDPLSDIAGWKPDLIHVHPFTAIFRGYQVAEHYNRPLFISMHGYYDFGIDRSPQGRKIGAYASKIITVEEGIKDLLTKIVEDPSKLVCIPNGIDLTQFEDNSPEMSLFEKYKLKPGAPTLLFISRLADGKELPLLQMLSQTCLGAIADKVGTLNFLVVGGGVSENQVIEKAFSLAGKMNLNMGFTGAVSDIRPYLSIADLVLGCGRVALESMASERPVVMTSMNGFAGAISKTNYVKAMLGQSAYEQWTDEMIVSCISGLLNDQDLLDSTVEIGYDLVRRFCNIKDNTDKLESIYREAIK